MNTPWSRQQRHSVSCEVSGSKGARHAVDTSRAVVICGVVVLEIADGQVTAERHY